MSVRVGHSERVPNGFRGGIKSAGHIVGIPDKGRNYHNEVDVGLHRAHVRAPCRSPFDMPLRRRSYRKTEAIIFLRPGRGASPSFETTRDWPRDAYGLICAAT